jgi:deoxyribodipyrimidine photo-lyase
MLLKKNKMNFSVEYDHIIEQLNNIEPVRYAKTRNFINGDVTYLSPYISRGVLTLPQIKEAVLSKGYKPYQIEKFLQELAWREFFQRVWFAKGGELFKDLKQTQSDVEHEQMITSVANAQTGITAIDDQINKLYETGYMHNHARMYVAGITCNIGKAYWKEPARWMYYHLLDGDLASNTCSWQWVAGSFSSKKYIANQENINRYANSQQQKTFLDFSYEQLQTTPVPEVLKPTSLLDLQTTQPVTQEPVIEKGKPVLIYNSYNLNPLWRKEEDANRIMLLEPSHFKNYPVSNKVLEFITALSKNINGLQIYCGEIEDLVVIAKDEAFVSKEHPAFIHYPGTKDKYDWMFPEVTGYHGSFFGYWKKCEKYLKN